VARTVMVAQCVSRAVAGEREAFGSSSGAAGEREGILNRCRWAPMLVG
jgi:hypothetical protein